MNVADLPAGPRGRQISQVPEITEIVTDSFVYTTSNVFKHHAGSCCGVAESIWVFVVYTSSGK
jgi:hypothetical protein